MFKTEVKNTCDEYLKIFSEDFWSDARRETPGGGSSSVGPAQLPGSVSISCLLFSEKVVPFVGDSFVFSYTLHCQAVGKHG